MTYLCFIIPTHNRYKVTVNAINSCLDYIKGDFAKYAIVVIDDCSTDNSAMSLTLEYSNLLKHDNFNIIQLTSNFGVVTARNVGISNTDAKWIALIDSDNQVIASQRSIVEDSLDKSTSPMVLFRCVDIDLNIIGNPVLPSNALLCDALGGSLPELFGIYNREVFLKYHKSPMLENIRRFEAYAFFGILDSYCVPIINTPARIYDYSLCDRLSSRTGCRSDADYMLIGHTAIFVKYFFRLSGRLKFVYTIKLGYYLFFALMNRPIRLCSTVYSILIGKLPSSSKYI